MVDTNPEQFDSGRSIAEKLQANVVEWNPNSIFVEYGPDDANLEPRTPLNELIFEASDEFKEDLYDLLVYGEPMSFTWKKTVESEGSGISSWLRSKKESQLHEISVRAEDGGSYFEIEEDGDVTPVPPEYRPEVLLNLAANADELGDAARSLRQIRGAIEDEYVNRNTVEQFLDRFPEDRVRPTRNGWVVDETYLITFDASNYRIDDPEVDVVNLDGATEFLKDLSFDISGSRTWETPSGDRVEVTENDQEFLVMVETFLNPGDYLGHDLTGKIVEGRENDAGGDDISSAASTVGYSGFRDPTIDRKSHTHTLEKHTLTQSFGVTQDVIDRLHFPQNTHAAPHELARREREFRRADFDVFHDTNNSDTERWKDIRKNARGIPISDETRRTLDSMFGSI